MKENALFYFAPSADYEKAHDIRFPVYLEGLSYSWNLAMAGSSNARNAQVNYPKRVEQSTVKASLRFPSIQRYRQFGDFVNDVNKALLSQTVAGKLWFYSPSVQGGFHYAVLIERFAMSFRSDMEPAPSANIDLTIVIDASGDGEERGSYVQDQLDVYDLTGDEMAPEELEMLASTTLETVNAISGGRLNDVAASDVAANGEEAFGPSNEDRRAHPDRWLR